MQELEVPEYLAHVDKRISEENERVLHYLDVGTRYSGNCQILIDFSVYFPMHFNTDWIGCF